MKIGIFDSGLGGLTIFKEILKEVDACFYYLGDNKNTPYGIKDENIVREYIVSNVQKLVNIGCKIIVIACNTATVIAIDLLREKFKDITFIGTVPAVKNAADLNISGKKILVSATTTTINSIYLKNLIDNLNITDKVLPVPLDKLVTFAEDKNINYDNVERYLKESFDKFNLNECEYLVLGCTHFPLFITEFKNILPTHIKIIDSSIGITNNLKSKIDNNEKTEKQITVFMTKESYVFESKVKEILNYEKITFKVIN